jgi:uncharacterized protein with PIN domain
MSKVFVTALDELNNLLPKKNRFKEVSVDFKGRQSVKHIIESLGIPHTEIGLIITNGNPVGFDYLVQDEDRINVHPASPENDQYSGILNNGNLMIKPKFILDNHLGKLATYLRIFGFDAMYHNDYQDDDLATDAVNLGRILLSRDRQLLMRKTIRYGYLIRSLEPDLQFIEIINRFNLGSLIQPFNRCLRCNTSLEPVNKETIVNRLQPKTKRYFQEFHICPHCDRIYWKGSHYDRMQQKIAELTHISKIENNLPQG